MTCVGQAWGDSTFAGCIEIGTVGEVAATSPGAEHTNTTRHLSPRPSSAREATLTPPAHHIQLPLVNTLDQHSYQQLHNISSFFLLLTYPGLTPLQDPLRSCLLVSWSRARERSETSTVQGWAGQLLRTTTGSMQP